MWLDTSKSRIKSSFQGERKTLRKTMLDSRIAEWKKEGEEQNQRVST
jgi:hypothetical protein